MKLFVELVKGKKNLSIVNLTRTIKNIKKYQMHIQTISIACKGTNKSFYTSLKKLSALSNCNIYLYMSGNDMNLNLQHELSQYKNLFKIIISNDYERIRPLLIRISDNIKIYLVKVTNKVTREEVIWRNNWSGIKRAYPCIESVIVSDSDIINFNSHFLSVTGILTPSLGASNGK